MQTFTLSYIVTLFYTKSCKTNCKVVSSTYTKSLLANECPRPVYNTLSLIVSDELAFLSYIINSTLEVPAFCTAINFLLFLEAVLNNDALFTTKVVPLNDEIVSEDLTPIL